MRFLPLALDLRGVSCLVVGGGSVAARKVETLLDAGAEVTLVSPEAVPPLRRAAGKGRLQWLRKRYEGELPDGVLLAVACTDDEEVNARLIGDAREHGVLACDASSSERSQVIFGALHREEGLTVAVFTDGQDPSRARSERDRIAAFLRGDRKEDGRIP